MFFTVKSFVTLPLSLILILLCVLPTPFTEHSFQDVIMTDSWRVNSESFWRTDLVFCTNTVYLMSATSLTSLLTWTGDHWRVIARGSWHIKPVQVLNPRNRCAKSSADDVHITLFPLSFIPSVFPYSYSPVTLFHQVYLRINYSLVGLHFWYWLHYRSISLYFIPICYIV